MASVGKGTLLPCTGVSDQTVDDALLLSFGCRGTEETTIFSMPCCPIRFLIGLQSEGARGGSYCMTFEPVTYGMVGFATHGSMSGSSPRWSRRFHSKQPTSTPMGLARRPLGGKQGTQGVFKKSPIHGISKPLDAPLGVANHLPCSIKEWGLFWRYFLDHYLKGFQAKRRIS
ncbi:MAG: hypothetical protein OXC92_08995 [Flavobacteriaceae bacterium]|nr:hypothetical protein [Flavobacteriaceae bacterium]